MLGPVLVLALLAPPAVVRGEAEVRREEPPPHGAIGRSTVFRYSDAAPGRTLEFRKRVLHPGAAIGVHPLSHDEVYYVLSGRGVVASDGRETQVGPGVAAYLYTGAQVGVRQVGRDDLVLIIAYPVPKTP